MAKRNVPQGAFDTSKPELDTATIERMERGASSNATGQSRRICLATMGRSIDQLNESSKEMHLVYLDMLSAAKDYRDHVKALLELSEAAVFRLELADEHGDTAAVLGRVSKKVSKKGGTA